MTSKFMSPGRTVPQDRVEVRSIVIQQAARIVDDTLNFLDAAIEYTRGSRDWSA